MAPGSIAAVVLAAGLLLDWTGQIAGGQRSAADHDGVQGCSRPHWLAVWGSSPSDAEQSTTLAGQTVRTIVTPLGSGPQMRVRLSNRFGAEPLVIESAFVGVQGVGPSVRPATSIRLRFKGARGVSIAPGEELDTDPVGLRVVRFRRLAISFHIAAESSAYPTRHLSAMQTTYVAPASAGDLSASEVGDRFQDADVQRTSARPIVTAIEVWGPGRAGAVVAFGDSITDGLQAPGVGIDADARYPDFLARRIARHPDVDHSVVNAGISGNFLRAAYVPALGPSALSRLHADVVAQRGVSDAIVLVGRNDFAFSEPPQVIAALRTLIRRLHRRGINVLLGTFSPSTSGQLPPGDELEQNGDRHEVNRWIRRQRLADAIVDFDRAVRDPEQPDSLLPAFSSGDGPHLSPAGYREMARTIDLDDLAGPRCGI